MPTNSSPVYGLPAPTDDDPFILGSLRIRQLRDKVEDVLTARWGTPWTPYTPPLTGFAVGNGILNAAYKKVGTTVNARVFFQAGSTSTFDAGATLLIGLPVPHAAGAYVTGSPLGVAFFLDASAGSLSRTAGIAMREGDSRVFLLTAKDSSATVTSTAPWAWAVGDQISLNFNYEVAP